MCNVLATAQHSSAVFVDLSETVIQFTPLNRTSASRHFRESRKSRENKLHYWKQINFQNYLQINVIWLYVNRRLIKSYNGKKKVKLCQNIFIVFVMVTNIFFLNFLGLFFFQNGVFLVWKLKFAIHLFLITFVLYCYDISTNVLYNIFRHFNKKI